MADPPLPPVRRERPPPKPEEERFVPKVASALAWPISPPDRVAQRRARANDLCLWLACDRALCRRERTCRGPRATCVLMAGDVERPLLDGGDPPPFRYR